MSVIQYWQGQSVELRVMFLGVDGVPLAAGGVAFRVKKTGRHAAERGGAGGP
jgi:hypothetical protein